MARIDYFGIEEAIVETLKADGTLGKVQYKIEEEVVMSKAPLILINLASRELADDNLGQPIAAGTRTRYLLNFSIWVYAFHLGGPADAAKVRAELLGKVELALMKNRTFNWDGEGDRVGSSWLAGGEFQTGPATGQRGFVSGAEISLIAEATAIN